MKGVLKNNAVKEENSTFQTKHLVKINLQEFR